MHSISGGTSWYADQQWKYYSSETGVQLKVL